MVPVAEGYEIAMLQLTALRQARRTRGVEHDKQRRRCDICLDRCSGCRQGDNVLGQQHLALVLIHDRTQFRIGNEQFGTRILHHEVQTLGRIAGIQWLIGATGFQHTH